MKKRLMSLVLCLVMVFSLFPLAALAVDSNTNPDGDSEYIAAWHTSPVFLNKDSDSSQAVSALSALRERTFRTRVQLTMVGDGSQVQLTYSNKYGTADLEIGEITLAKGVASDINKITGRIASIKASQLSPSAAWEGNVVRTNTSYYGHTVWVIPAGQTVKTKPIDISALGLSAMDYLCVSTWVTNMHHFGDGFTAGLTGGRTAYLGLTNTSGSYNHTEVADLDDVGIISPVELTRSDDTGDYNVIPFLTEIDVKRANPNQYATVLFGDSTLANDIPTLLGSRLLANNIEGVAFVSSAIKGNELLKDGQNGTNDNNGSLLGKSGLSRFNDEVLNLPGVKKVIVKLGINDILHPYCSNLSQNYDQLPTAQAIIDGYKSLARDAHDAGVEIYFYELSPWQGYTRDNTLAYSDSIDAVRREVNAYLATGKPYDDDLSDLSGNSFGYIPLDSMNDSGDANKLKAAFTTDGIHYSKGGQSQVAKLTPLPIFWKTETNEDNLGEEVTIRNIYFATSSLNADHNYFICNTNASSVRNSSTSNQEMDGVVAGNPGKNTTNTDMYTTSIFHNDENPASDLMKDVVKVQRGSDGAPYIIGGADQARDIWSLSRDSDDRYYWLNNGYYLGWHYKGTTTQATAFSTGVRSEKPYGNSQVPASGKWYSYSRVDVPQNNDYQVNLRFGAVGEDKYLIYRPTNEQNGHIKAGFNTVTFDSGIGYFTNGWSKNLTLYDNTANGVTAKLDIIQGSNPSIVLNGITDKTDNSIVYGKGASDNVDLFYQLNSVMLNNLDQPTGQEFSDTGVSNGNNAAGPFKLYTFGTDQRIFWSSSDKEVVTVSQSDGYKGGGVVSFTGKGGTAAITLNYFWQEFDGVDYRFLDNNGQYYTEAQKDAAIADGTMPESSEVAGYHWFMVGQNGEWVYTNYHYLTSDTVITNVVDYDVDILLDGATDDGTAEDTFNVTDVTPNSTATLEVLPIVDPSGAPFKEGGHWVWETIPANSNIASISEEDGEFAKLTYTGKEGTVQIKVSYQDSNGVIIDELDNKPLESTITIITKEKPLDIDIKVDGVVTDYYANEHAAADIQIPLEAFLTPDGTHTNGDYIWKVVSMNEDGEEIDDVLTLSDATAFNPTATVNRDGVALVEVSYTYHVDDSDPNSREVTVKSMVLINIKYYSVIVDFGAAYLIDKNVFHVDPKDGAQGFDLPVKPGDLTFTPPFSKTTGTSASGKNTVTYNYGAFDSVVGATYYTGADKDEANTIRNDVTVIPASNIYYSDSLDEVTLTPNDQFGYNAGVTYSDPTAQSGTFTFTFTGTRIDVYCTTAKDSGLITAKLTKSDNSTETQIIKTSVPSDADASSRVSAPSVSFSGLSGTNTLQITASSTANFKLEGVRVYNANSANADVEPNARYINLRDVILSKAAAYELKEKNTEETGAFFFDGYNPESEEGWEIEDYTNNGPKNEVYLTAGQAVAFTVPENTKVMVSVRAPEATGGTIKINNADTIDVTNVDMYYPVTVDSKDNSVLIANDGTSTISIVNVKLTGAAPVEPDKGTLKASPKLMRFVSRVMTTEAQDTPAPTETTAPAETSEPTSTPSIQSILQQLISNFVRSLFGSISRLFGH